MRVLVAALLTLTVLASMLGPFTSRVSAVSEGALSVAGTRIVNPVGDPVILRGVNYVGYESDRVAPVPHSETAYKLFAQVGFNVVRLPISWASLERSPGKFNELYLAKFVDQDVRWAKKYGLYVVLDMHQMHWGTKFGGSGTPAWLVANYPRTEDGMRRAVTDFWTQTKIQEHLVQVWRKIAQRYVNETTIAGYDILNEPWVYTSINSSLSGSDVNAFYMRVIEAIRSVDANHIVFLEPANMVADFALKDKIVWSPHFYPLSFYASYNPSDAALLEADVAAKHQRFVLDMGGPMWIGEFGAFMKDTSSDIWLRDSVRAFDEYEVGWAWWAFSGMDDRIPSQLYTTQQQRTTMGENLPIGTVEQAISFEEVFLAVAILCIIGLLAALAVSIRRR